MALKEAGFSWSPEIRVPLWQVNLTETSDWTVRRGLNQAAWGEITEADVSELPTDGDDNEEV